MAGLATAFGWLGGRSSEAADGLPEIFTMDMPATEFIRIDVQTMFAKILTDVLERTQGLEDDQQALLWDNCIKSQSSEGLITMVAKAMYEKADLYLVYDESIKVVRKANGTEQAKIQESYLKKADSLKVESAVGVYITFKNFLKCDMIKLYSAFEYNAVASLNKTMNLSKAIQFKIHELRSGVSLMDKSKAEEQAIRVWTALKNGKDTYMDAKDVIETAKPDLEPLKEGLVFLNQRRAFYLGLTEAYITGVQTGGLNATGEADRTALERGLKSYYFSIMKPILESLFDVTLSYKSQDYRQIDQAMSAIKTFNITDNSLVGPKMKRSIIEGLLDIDPDDNDTEEPEEIPAGGVDPITGLPVAGPSKTSPLPGQPPVKAVPNKGATA